MNTDAQTMFHHLLANHVQEVIDYVNLPLEQTGLIDQLPPKIEMTHFNDPYDTLIYSRLIRRALELNSQVRTVLDLGAGSSLSTLLALRANPGISTIAVDIDSEAILVGQNNAERFGLSQGYTFLQSDICSALKEISTGPSTLVVSNPPYIATPSEIEDHFFTPIDGGVKGSDYLLQILKQQHPTGTPLALLWGSLTCPDEIIPLIAERYEIIHLEAYRIHFGIYTQHPLIRPYLYHMRDKGIVYFEGDEKKGEVQLVLGTILRHR
jgi:methylase of polypeptide subunit release factors